MKTKFKPCNKKIKVPFGNILENYKGISHLDAMFRKYNFGVFNKSCIGISKNMINCHKAYKKVPCTKKCCSSNNKDSIDILPDSGYDICNNYTNTSCSCNEMDSVVILPDIEQDICDNYIDTSSDSNKMDSINTLEDDEHYIYDNYINTSSRGNRIDNIDVLPASGHDIFNHLTQYGMSDFQIQTVMKLDGKLDFEKLKRAVRLSVDAEPIFGCRFVEDDPPYWKRLDNIDEITFCSMEEAINPDEAVMRFLQTPLDMDNDPNVKVKIIRSEQYDILGIKINQTCCDGTDTKEYIHLLSDIYSRIDQEDSTFIPGPEIASGNVQNRLFKELSTTCPDLRWSPLMETPKTMWAFQWIQRGDNSKRFSVCRFPQGTLESIYQYGKSKGATVNDLILTAFYRTMFRISIPTYGVPMDISSTIDLRRYLPDHMAQAARNLSGGFITRIARTMNESFEGTLSKVVDATKKIKDRHPGMDNAMSGEYVENTSFTYFHNYFEHMSQISEITAHCRTYIGNVCFPELSNLGYISKSLINFGKNVVTDAYIIPPVIRAPGLMLLASSYNDILTLSIGYCRTSISQKHMEDLLNKVKYELLRGCSSGN